MDDFLGGYPGHPRRGQAGVRLAQDVEGTGGRGIRVGKERVRRMMQEHGIKARGKRKFVVTRVRHQIQFSRLFAPGTSIESST